MLKISIFASVFALLFTAKAAYVINSTMPSEDEEDVGIVVNIINGKIATKNEYPFISQLFYTKDKVNYQFACTASLIGPSHIVTAGHCVNDGNRSPISADHYKVMVGSTSLTKGADIQNLLPVAQVYNLGFKENPNNDIAIIKLVSPVPASMATPVKVYPYKILNTLPLEVAGFGVTKSGNTTPSDVLLKTTIQVSSTVNCTAFNDGWKSNSGNQFCSESYNGNDSCQGDSGGPIVAMLGGKRVIAGVTSFGTNKDTKSDVNCGENVVAYYTRIAFFLNQIATIMGVPVTSLYNTV